MNAVFRRRADGSVPVELPPFGEIQGIRSSEG